jgi:hypothetical protein
MVGPMAPMRRLGNVLFLATLAMAGFVLYETYEITPDAPGLGLGAAAVVIGIGLALRYVLGELI